MTLGQARDDLLRRCSITDVSTAPHPVLRDIAAVISAAFQVMWLSPHDFFRRVPYTLSTVAGTEDYTLPQGMQELIKPLLLNGTTPLFPTEQRAEFVNWSPRYLGSAGGTNATPRAFYIDGTYQTGADSVAVKLRLTPTPDDIYSIAMHLVYECPHYDPSDLCSNADDALPIPHNYAETLFLPIARGLLVEQSVYCRMPDKADGLINASRIARMTLGLADPDEGTKKSSAGPPAPEPPQAQKQQS